MDDTQLQQATVISLTPCRGFDQSIWSTIFVQNLMADDGGIMLILHGDEL